MYSFFKLIVILNCVVIAILWDGIFRTGEKSILSALTFRSFSNMLANASNRVGVAKLILDRITKCFELSPGPFELMIPVPHLSFLKLEIVIKFLVWRRNEAKLWFQIAKNIVHSFGNVFRDQMLDHFNQGDQVYINFLHLLVLFGDISAINVHFLIFFP